VSDATHQILQHVLNGISRITEKHGRQGKLPDKLKKSFRSANIDESDDENRHDRGFDTAVANTISEITGFTKQLLGPRAANISPNSTEDRKRKPDSEISEHPPSKRAPTMHSVSTVSNDGSSSLTDPMLVSHRGKQNRKKSSCENRATSNQAKSHNCTFCTLKGHNRQTCPLYESFGIEIDRHDAVYVGLKVEELAESLPLLAPRTANCTFPTTKDCRYVIIRNRVQVSDIEGPLFQVSVLSEPTTSSNQLIYITLQNLSTLVCSKGFKGLFVQRSATV